MLGREREARIKRAGEWEAMDEAREAPMLEGETPTMRTGGVSEMICENMREGPTVLAADLGVEGIGDFCGCGFDAEFWVSGHFGVCANWC